MVSDGDHVALSIEGVSVQLGAAAIDLNALLRAANPCPRPLGNPEYDAWLAQYNKLLAEADAFTQGGTQYTRTRKYYFMRSEIAKQWAREPVSRCMIEMQKAGRKISDFQALNEIRKPRITLANDWRDRATKAERMQQIQLAATVATIATAGAAAIAAASGASAAGLGASGAIKAAAASSLGVPAASSQSLKAIGMTALKKLALEKGVKKAVEVAAGEYLRYQQKKMTKAQEKALAIELAAAEKEYAELLAQGKNPASAAQVASTKGGDGAIIPLGLAVLAFKFAMG